MTCPTCGADIIDAETGGDRRIVHLDPDPVDDGNVELFPARDDRGPYAVTWGTAHRWPEGVNRWRIHRCTEQGAA